MKKHLITKLLITMASIMGLGMISISTTSNHVASPVIVHASQNESKLTNRISKFAYQRRKYYYPQITYNTRDFGGLRTANGRYEIRPHMLYRSANLHYINRHGVREINYLRIYHDIDLRAIHGPNTSISAKPQPCEYEK